MKTVFYSRVIDAVSDTPIENGMVVVDDDKIIYVGEEKEYDDSSAATYRLEVAADESSCQALSMRMRIFAVRRASIKAVTHRMIFY